MKPLVTGVCSGNLRLVLSALKQGANANARYRDRPVLLWAIQEGHINIVKALVRAGASLERRDKLGFTPLDQAVGEGNIQLVKFLLSAGAKVNGRTANGSPLHTACAYRRLEIVKMLLDHGANPRSLDSEGRRPIDFVKIKSNAMDKKLQKLLNNSEQSDQA